ncbi:MAG: VWA domain-containing protein, partial [Bryobacterales bacterium]|nr:VWA domain-containing protein [Bryobacterales bacterium]
MSVTPTARTIGPAGQPATFTATITASGAFSSPVALSVAGLPPGVSGIFNPPAVQGGGTAVLSVQASGNAPLGSATATITATSGALVQTQQVTVTVSNLADFSLSSGVSGRTIPPGAMAQYPLAITAVNGFNSVLNFSVTGLPNGTVATFSPATLASSGAVTMTLATSAGTPTGTFPLRITASGGTITREVQALLTINPGAGYSLSATPQTATVSAGSNTTFTVTLTAAGGFDGMVQLNSTGLPEGASASYSPAILNGAGTSTVTVNTTGSTQTSSYPVTFTGTSGIIAQQAAAVTLSVNGQPNFTLAATPTSAPLTPGASTTFTITLTPINGFSGTASLSQSGAPAGSTVTFNPASITGSGASTMAITVPGGTSTGTYPITVSATAGSLTKTTPVQIVVNPALTFEAEDSGNTLSGGAAVINCTGCGNSQRVELIGKQSGTPNGVLIFNGVSVGTAGTYTMTVYYTNGSASARTASISVNNSASTLSFSGGPTGSWTTVASVARNITLNAGSNTIKFFNDAAQAPDIDRIVLVNTAACTPSPADVTIVIDRSGSVGGQPFASIKNAAKTIVDALNLSTDQISVVSFTTSGTLNQMLTQNGTAAKNAIDALSSGGGTYIKTGIDTANVELFGTRGNPAASKTIVLLSDGVDVNPPDPNGTVNAATAAKAAGIRFISVAYGNANTTLMQQLASSPADYYAAPTGAQLEALAANIASSLCRPVNQAPVVNAGPDLTVQIQQGATLQGSVSDDGLPLNATLSMSWTKVSGPGTVTFSNASSPVTAATFSTTGTYVLQLSASDTSLSGTDTVTVTVGSTTGVAGLVLSPAAGGPVLAGMPYTLQATLKNASGTPVSGQTVNFVV